MPNTLQYLILKEVHKESIQNVWFLWKRPEDFYVILFKNS